MSGEEEECSSCLSDSDLDTVIKKNIQSCRSDATEDKLCHNSM